MLFVLVSILPSVLCWTYQDELNFRKAHFKNYDKNIRPLKYMNDVVQINAALQLNSAQKFDIVNGLSYFKMVRRVTILGFHRKQYNEYYSIQQNDMASVSHDLQYGIANRYQEQFASVLKQHCLL